MKPLFKRWWKRDAVSKITPAKTSQDVKATESGLLSAISVFSDIGTFARCYDDSKEKNISGRNRK